MDQPEDNSERAPLFGNWNYWYALVIGFLVFCIAVFYYLTKHFS